MPVVRSALHNSAARRSSAGSPLPVDPCSQRDSSRIRSTRSSSEPSLSMKVRRASRSMRSASFTLRSSSKKNFPSESRARRTRSYPRRDTAGSFTRVLETATNAGSRRCVFPSRTEKYFWWPRISEISTSGGSSRKLPSKWPATPNGSSTRPVTVSSRSSSGSGSPPASEAARCTSSQMRCLRSAQSASTCAARNSATYFFAGGTANSFGAANRCPRVVAPLFTSAKERGSGLPSSRAEIQCTGRANASLSSESQRIDFLNGMPRMIRSRIPGRASAADWPRICCSTTTRSPSTRSADTGTPSLRANPSAALVGFPSWNAAFAGGPCTVLFTSGDRAAIAVTTSARRRGVAYPAMFARCPSPSPFRRASSSARFISAAIHSSAGLSDPAGSSSHPISKTRSIPYVSRRRGAATRVFMRPVRPVSGPRRRFPSPAGRAPSRPRGGWRSRDP